MKILVLGATGGTGRLIVKEAMAKGHHVVALVRSKANAAGLAGAELVEGDARDEAARGRIRALTDLSGVHGGQIARADVADFVVQQLTADTWLRQMPLITWQDAT
jgi:nucleoside-diphosphate-sugar epimerase